MNRLLIALLLVPSIHAMVVPSRSTEPVRLINSKHVYVEDDNAAYRVAPHNMNKELREAVARKVLDKYKQAAFIKANKQMDGSYTLYGKTRGVGGTGIVTAGVVNFAVRFGLWTAFLVGTSTPVVVGTLTTGPGGGVAAGTAVQVGIATAGGLMGVATGIEAAAAKAALLTLACPLPLP